jgi:hypothetical protein
MSQNGSGNTGNGVSAGVAIGNFARITALVAIVLWFFWLTTQIWPGVIVIVAMLLDMIFDRPKTFWSWFMSVVVVVVAGIYIYFVVNGFPW